MKARRVVTKVFVVFLGCGVCVGSVRAGNSLDAADGTPPNAVYVDAEGNVGIGTTDPLAKLTVAGAISASEEGLSGPYDTSVVHGGFLSGVTTFGRGTPGGYEEQAECFGDLGKTRGEDFIGVYGESRQINGAYDCMNYGGYFKADGYSSAGVYGYAHNGTGGRFEGTDIGVFGCASDGFGGSFTGTDVGIYARSASDGFAGVFAGRVKLIDAESGNTVLELGEGLDYAEGFDVSAEKQVDPGCVLVIDSAHPGKLTLSQHAYDKRVAGIAAGAQSRTPGVRLGVGQFDCDVALAGRVYCNVDARRQAIEPGDLLTTSDLPGYAMKAANHGRAIGAILGKAMEPLQKGKKGQILVLVTLQ